jgi:hypothetical protein
MKYRKTFREALNDVEKKGKPEAKPEVADEKPVEDKDATIKKLQDEITALKLQAQIDKTAAQPNKDTGEVPLRTGIGAALLDKDGPQPKIEKSKKEKVKLNSGKSKITINPDVNLGQISGGNKVNTGTLH